MRALGSIIKGFTNLLRKKLNVEDSEIEELAKLRYVKCLKCPERKDDDTCAPCGCYLGAKTRSLEEKCPIGKW